jgi:hypothetical protein
MANSKWQMVSTSPSAEPFTIYCLLFTSPTFAQSTVLGFNIWVRKFSLKHCATTCVARGVDTIKTTVHTFSIKELQP